METFLISVPEQKTNLVKQLLKELGVIITPNNDKQPNQKTLASMTKTSKGKDLTKTSSHEDLMHKLNS
jgi:antitoxin component of RelBE/YafQ-DinJ toxin-antitoxin module